MRSDTSSRSGKRDFVRQRRKWGSPGWSHRESYEGLHLGAVVHRARLRLILRVIESLNLDNIGSLADFGCSDGFILSLLYEQLFRDREWVFYGFDVKHDLLQRVSERCIPRARFEAADLNEADVTESGQFDLVLCFETVEHTGNYKNAVLNVARSCKVGGHILMSVPHEMGWRGVAKFLARKALQIDPYGNFFNGKSQWRYFKETLTNGDIEQFRQPPCKGWGPHLGFDIHRFEAFLEGNLFNRGEYCLVETYTSFLGFNRLYMIERVA